MTLRRGVTHVTTAMALDYLEGVLDARGRAKVEEHLGQPCPECHERMRELGGLVDRMRRDRTPEVPPDLHARALGVFPSRSRASTAYRLLDELARLLFDSGHEPLTAAVRRSVGASRRMTYAFTGGGLEIELEPESQEIHTVRGRLQLPEAGMHQIEVVAGTERFRVWPGADGGFLVEHVPRGTVAIRIVGPAGRFVIPTLEC